MIWYTCCTTSEPYCLFSIEIFFHFQKNLSHIPSTCSHLFPTTIDNTSVNLAQYFYWIDNSKETKFRELLTALNGVNAINTTFYQYAFRYGRKTIDQSPPSALIVFFVLMVPHLASLDQNQQLIDGGYYDGNTSLVKPARRTGRLRNNNENGIPVTQYKQFRIRRHARSNESVASPLVISRMTFKSCSDLSNAKVFPDTGMSSIHVTEMKLWEKTVKNRPIFVTSLEEIEDIASRINRKPPPAEPESPPKQQEETTLMSGRKRKTVDTFTPGDDSAPKSNTSQRQKRQDTKSSSSTEVNYANMSMDKLRKQYKNDTKLAETMHTFGILIHKLSTAPRVPKHIKEFVESNVKGRFYRDHQDCFLSQSSASSEEESNEPEPALTKEEIQLKITTMAPVIQSVDDLDIEFVLAAFEWDCRDPEKKSQMGNDIRNMQDRWCAFTVDEQIGDAIRDQLKEETNRQQMVIESALYIKELGDKGWISSLSKTSKETSKIVLCWKSEHTKFSRRVICKSLQSARYLQALSLVSQPLLAPVAPQITYEKAQRTVESDEKSSDNDSTEDFVADEDSDDNVEDEDGDGDVDDKDGDDSDVTPSAADNDGDVEDKGGDESDVTPSAADKSTSETSPSKEPAVSNIRSKHFFSNIENFPHTPTTHSFRQQIMTANQAETPKDNDDASLVKLKSHIKKAIDSLDDLPRSGTKQQIKDLCLLVGVTLSEDQNYFKDNPQPSNLREIIENYIKSELGFREIDSDEPPLKGSESDAPHLGDSTQTRNQETPGTPINTTAINESQQSTGPRQNIRTGRLREQLLAASKQRPTRLKSPRSGTRSSPRIEERKKQAKTTK